MTSKDASFLLGSYRPNGADSTDPEFSDALAQAARDPALDQWFQDQRQFDSAIAAGLQSLPLPADLRSRILTGGRISRISRPASWRLPRRLWAIAAMLLLFAGLAVQVSLRSRHASAQWQNEALTALSGLSPAAKTSTPPLPASPSFRNGCAPMAPPSPAISPPASSISPVSAARPSSGTAIPSPSSVSTVPVAKWSTSP